MWNPIDWITGNREWVFSGIGRTIIEGILKSLRSVFQVADTKPADDDNLPHIEFHPVNSDPSAPSYFFMLPDGNTVDPMEVQCIKIYNDEGYHTVHCFVGNQGHMILSTRSRRRAIRTSRKLADELNRARGYRPTPQASSIRSPDNQTHDSA